MTDALTPRSVHLFNGPVEIGMRSLAILAESFPSGCSIQRLVILDYLIVHSDDLPDGPEGLHPKTPHRAGELIVRRTTLQEGLLLYESRGLIERRYEQAGITFYAAEAATGFLDVLISDYAIALRQRAEWLVERFTGASDVELQQLVRDHLGEWGAEFSMESVLWSDGAP